MNKEWVKKKNAERRRDFYIYKEEVLNKAKSYDKFRNDEMKNKVIDIISQADFDSDSRKVGFELEFLEHEVIFAYIFEETSIEDHDERLKWYKDNIENITSYMGGYDHLLDSELMEFDGDIIITDPCYIKKNREDWDKCEYGFCMENLGINHYITEDTIWGDWSCAVFTGDTIDDSSKVLGKFCADSGLVSVFDLNEVLKYNPKFDSHITRPWTTTVIKDFKGTVQIVKEEHKWYSKEDKQWNTSYEVKVKGNGHNRVTGEPIIFTSGQTGC